MIRAIILALMLCLAGMVSAGDAVGDSETWVTQAGLSVSGEEAECDLAFDAMPDELAFAQGGCCRVCKKGKACGNSCINRDYTCRQPRGCACDG
ncbi:MAG: hypothetical protein KA748_02610 [Halomonas sp.]|nr:hypothetical protein [Halomonas sp.]MBP5979074.1 hypothetical protein [Halomonas sp.]